MNICRLNRSSKICMKKGLARHTRTPPSSLPEPKIILTYIVQPRLGSWTHFPGCIALPYSSHITIWTHLLFNEYCRRSPRGSQQIAADRRSAQIFITALFLSIIPCMFTRATPRRILVLKATSSLTALLRAILIASRVSRSSVFMSFVAYPSSMASPCLVKTALWQRTSFAMPCSKRYFFGLHKSMPNRVFLALTNLLKCASEVPLHLFESTVKHARGKRDKIYHPAIRKFALSLHLCSAKAYRLHLYTYSYIQ